MRFLATKIASRSQADDCQFTMPPVSIDFVAFDNEMDKDQLVPVQCGGPMR